MSGANTIVEISGMSFKKKGALNGGSSATGSLINVLGGAKLTLDHVSLTGGYVEQNGGVMLVDSTSQLILKSNILMQQGTASKGYGGGLYCAGDCTFEISNATTFSCGYGSISISDGGCGQLFFWY